jgi:hypothetical protein
MHGEVVIESIKNTYMKKILSVLVVLISISSVARAGVAPNPWVSSKSSKMGIMKSGDLVKVFYKNEEVATVKVTIYNQANKIVFSEEVKNHSDFLKPYNLAGLPEGKYRVVMQDEEELREEYVSTIKEHTKALIGIIKANEHQFAVTFFSKEQSDLRVTLLDDEGNVLFAENYRVAGRDTKLFDLKTRKGAVVEVSDKDGVIRSTTL